VDVDAKAVYTNNPNAGAMRGFGSNQAQFAMEGVMDMLADKVGVDGWDIRERNILNPGDKLGTGQVMRESVRGIRETLNAVKDVFKRARYKGIGCGIKSTGLGNGTIEGGHIRIRVLEGGRLEIFNGYTEMGQEVGSIGVPFEGIEMTIAESDGEILVRGRNVMQGYYNNPEETARVLDAEGFYHTGDVGYQDKDGHFFVTDRLKDLFKLSNGKYVAPLQLESLLKQSPLVSQPVVVGSGRKQVGALIVPDWEALKEALKEKGIPTDRTREELCEDPQVIKFMQREAVELTRELSDYERVKRVYMLPREFSIDKGEMTPTLKIKRSVIDEKYEEAIDEICGS
jgi:acyl-CoA synthetase (AMP-forming)/AMP-acid ligase II